MTFYKRNLPHWYPENAEYFISFRLAGSLPEIAFERLKQEQIILSKGAKANRKTDRLSVLRSEIHKHIFKKYDKILDAAESGPTWLNDPVIAIHYREKKKVFDLYAYCIMPNHVHIIFKPIINEGQAEQPYLVSNIMKSLKWFTALTCNEILNRIGNQFWQSESYDHVIRDADELEGIINYTLNNPIKAGLIDNWRYWPFSYLSHFGYPKQERTSCPFYDRIGEPFLFPYFRG